MLTPEQVLRLQQFLLSPAGTDLLGLVSAAMTSHLNELTTADDQARMFRAQGKVKALSDLLALLDSVKRTAPPEGQA